MSDETLKLLASVLGTIATVLLGLITNGIINISKKQNEHTIQIELLKQSTENVIKRVDSLHEWRNALNRAEIEGYREMIKELKEGDG